jgi:hypothetical protein
MFNLSTIIAAIEAQDAAGLTSSFTALVQGLSGLGVGLLATEAQDFDNYIDGIVEGVEAGKSFSDAEAAAASALATAEKSQLMSAALAALKLVSNFFDGAAKLVTGALSTVESMV